MGTHDLVPAEPESGAVASYMPSLFRLAVEKGPDGVAALEKLVALQERMEDRNAAREFAEAMAAFQERCPPIRKTSTAKVVTKSGGSYGYQYAELDEIARTVRPILHSLGLSYSWDSTLSENGSMLRVVCTVTHANGHSAHAAFEAPTEAVTQAMSPQQRHAAALTFARRQSLIQVLGLTTCDPDTDAAEHHAAMSGPCVSMEQADMLEGLLTKAPDGTRARMLSYLGVETVEQVPASRFEEVASGLKKKIGAQA